MNEMKTKSAAYILAAVVAAVCLSAVGLVQPRTITVRVTGVTDEED